MIVQRTRGIGVVLLTVTGLCLVKLCVVLRDSNGKFIMVFSWRFGFCSVLEAELWGIITTRKLLFHVIVSTLVIKN